MKKLPYKDQKVTLTKYLLHFKFQKKYFIYPADGRLGQKFAIASESEHGGLNIHSGFMTYDEMNCYLKGYDSAINFPL